MGTKTGWIIATLIVVGVAIAAMAVIFFPPVSGPSETRSPAMLEMGTVYVPLVRAIGREPTIDGDAGPDYQRAIEIHMNNSPDIEAVGNGDHWDDLVGADNAWTDPGLKKIKEIHAIVAGAAKKKWMKYTFAFTDKELAFGFHHQAPEKFWKLAVSLRMLADMLAAKGRYAEAAEVIKDILIMGRHMYDEHAVAYMGLTGLEVQEYAAKALQKLYRTWKEAPKEAAGFLQKYETEVGPILNMYRKKKEILWDNIPKNNEAGDPKLAPGDVFNILEHDQDPAWRVQAVIALGALKFRVAGRGDRKYAFRLIRQCLQSKEPAIAAAAKVADSLTREQFHYSSTPH